MIKKTKKNDIQEYKRRTFLKKSLGIFTGLLISSDFAMARRRKQSLVFFKDKGSKNNLKEKLIKLYQRPYNGMLYIDFLKFLAKNDVNLAKDKMNVRNIMFFNIHIFSLDMRNLTQEIIKILYTEKNLSKTNNVSKVNKILNNGKYGIQGQKKIKKKKLTQEKTNKNNKNELEEIKKKSSTIDLSKAILYYGGNSYLSIDNLFLYRKFNVINKILKNIHNQRISFKELYLKSLWSFFEEDSIEKYTINVDFVKTQIGFIEKRIFRVPFEKQKRKFRDKKFRTIWKHLFYKKKYEQFNSVHYEFVYLLSLLSFYYSLIGYKNYSLLFLNKIKEKFLINFDLKTIMFYFYINLMGNILVHNYNEAISYFETILNFDKFLYYEELGFLIYSKAALFEFNNQNYRLAWQYANQAVKYGINLNPTKYVDQIIYMKKILKQAADKYIYFLKEGNNFDLINYVQTETLKTLSLTF